MKKFLYIFLLLIINGLTNIASAQTNQNPRAIADFMESKGKSFGLTLELHAADPSIGIPYRKYNGRPRLIPPDDYLKRISPYFDYYTVFMSFWTTEPKQGLFTLDRQDALMIFAAENNASVKGHTLFYPSTTPNWVKQGNFTPDQLSAILKNHVQTLVKHFKQLKEKLRVRYPAFKIDYQVTNETVCNNTKTINDPNQCTQPGEILSDGTTIDPRLVGLKKNIWSVVHKPGSSDPSDYIQLAFQWAHEIDPEAKLYFDENVFTGPFMNNTYQIVSYFKEHNVPINGVGIEGHVTLGWSQIPTRVQGSTYYLNTVENLASGVTAGGEKFVGMKDFANLGLEVQITEFDVMLTNAKWLTKCLPILPDQGDLYTEALAKQADLYRDFLNACVETSNCSLFNIFGAWDPMDWTIQRGYKIPQGGQYRPFIIDDDWHLKPAYWAMVQEATNG